MEIFQFERYQDFIKARIESLPRKGRGQYRKLAEFLEINSVLVSQVMNDQREFNEEQAVGIAKYFALSDSERDFLLLLVQKSRAGTVELKEIYNSQIQRLKMNALKLENKLEDATELSGQAKSEFYSNWLYAGVQMASAKDGKQTIEQISETLGVSRKRVSEILKFLLKYGLCEEENGRYFPGPAVTHIKPDSPHSKTHTQNWRMKASQKVLDKSEGDFFYTAPLICSKTDAEKIRERMICFVKEVVETVRTSECEELVCFNIDWFGFGRDIKSD